MADINQLKEQVRDANDIVDVIGSYISLKKSGSNYMGLCPFHGEKTPSFSVSPGRQGKIISFSIYFKNNSLI